MQTIRAHANDRASKGTARYAIAALLDRILPNRAVLLPRVQGSMAAFASHDQLRCECEIEHPARPSAELRGAALTESHGRARHSDCESWIPRFKADRDGGSAAPRAMSKHMRFRAQVTSSGGALDPPYQIRVRFS